MKSSPRKAKAGKKEGMKEGDQQDGGGKGKEKNSQEWNTSRHGIKVFP